MAASSSSSSVLKRKRSQPGNPNPDAEVIALSPKTLMATNRFICEVCNKGFQREQNLQLHRRGHNLPWKLKQKNTKDLVRKKVYLCPEPTCAHHDPSRALGDLTGIKKHYLRKHGEKKHKCEKCAKKYAVVSDWKAHSKTCGTREYRCDCGTLFSRRDSFITHRAFCIAITQETDRNTLNLNPAPFSGHLLSGFSRISDTTQDQINTNLPFMNHEALGYGSRPAISQFDNLIGPAFCLPPLSMQQQQLQNNEESHLLNKPSLHSLMQQQISLENGVCSSSGFFNLSFFPENANNNDNASVQDSAIFTSGNNQHHLMNMTVPSFYNGGAGQTPATTFLQKASLYGSTTDSGSSTFKPMPPSFGMFEGNNNHLQDLVNSMTSAGGGGGGSSSSIVVPSPFESKPTLEAINNNNNNGLFLSTHGLDLESEIGLKLTRDFMGVEREIQHRSRRISMDHHHLNSGSSSLNSFTWKPTP